MAKDRKTGLGTAAFFQQPGSTVTPAASQAPVQTLERPGEIPTEGEHRPERSAAPKKVRTTVLLYPETLANMEDLKIRARRRGDKATFSDILEQAIRMLMEKYQVEL